MNITYAALVKGIFDVVLSWRKSRNMKRELQGIARARMDEWEVDRFNADLRDHHEGRNPTTRITIKPSKETLQKIREGHTT